MPTDADDEPALHGDDKCAAEVLTDCYDALEHAQGSADVRTQMEKFCRQMGFSSFAYALTLKIPSLKPQRHFINGYPQRWLERYLARDYFAIDPLVKHAQTSTLPAVWGERTLHDSSATEFWEEARSVGLSSGLSFVISERAGATGIFSLARDTAMDQSGQELAALIGRGQMFASLVHHACCRLQVPKLLPQANTVLTARERECLKWSADGKTAWELGQILGISARTAVFHLNNAMQKLGATNKTQAIVRAVALQLI